MSAFLPLPSLHLPTFRAPSALCEMHERIPLLGSTVPPPRPPILPRTSTPDNEPDPSFNPVTLYTNLLNEHPLKTKILTSSILTGLSDVITQFLESTHSPRRALSMAIAGGLLTAPMFHYLYAYLEHVIPSTSVKGIVTHLLTDQLLAAPVWLALFLPLIPLLEGRSLETASKHTRRDYRPALMATWSIFPVVQVINFSIVPVKARVLVLNVCDLVFTAVLSWIMHRDKGAG